MEDKKTMVIGASGNPERYSNKAVRLLQAIGIPHVAYGLRQLMINDTKVTNERLPYSDIHTITLYVGPQRQDANLLDYIISLAPERVIFNPGTEHMENIQKIKTAGIEIEIACTLVLLRTSQY